MWTVSAHRREFIASFLFFQWHEKDMKTRAFWYTQTYNYTLTVIGYKQCFPFQSFDGRSADELTFKVPAQSCESTRGKRLDCRLLPLVFIGCNTCTCTRGNRAHISSGSNGGTHWLLLESKTWSKRKIHRPTETHTHHVNHLPHGFCSKSPRKPFLFYLFPPSPSKARIYLY